MLYNEVNTLLYTFLIGETARMNIRDVNNLQSLKCFREIVKSKLDFFYVVIVFV